MLDFGRVIGFSLEAHSNLHPFAGPNLMTQEYGLLVVPPSQFASGRAPTHATQMQIGAVIHTNDQQLRVLMH